MTADDRISSSAAPPEAGPLFDLFPREQLLCLKYEDIEHAPEELAALLHRFLAVAPRPEDARGLGIINPSEKADAELPPSARALLVFSRRDPRFGGIRLSRNYGSHVALTAGFENARGDAVATLACDLQDPPEIILEFLKQWKEGHQIVWGRRRTRSDPRWKIWTSRLYYALVKRYAMPRSSRFTTGSFLLVDRLVADGYREFKEHSRITFALVAWTGFDQSVVEYDRRQRVAGVSGWNFGRMMKSMYDTFIGFSTAPIRMMTFLGLGVFFLSMLLSLYLVWNWLQGSTLPGWTGLMFTMAVFFGAQFLLMGVTGEYLYRIYAEVVRRPLYFVSARTAPRSPPEADVRAPAP